MSEDAAKEWSAEAKELGDKIVALTLLQAKELADYLKEVHGIEAAAGGGAIMMAAPAAGGEGGGEAEAPSAYDVVLTKLADSTKKISVIKVVRELTGKGLKEAKEIVDGAPQTVKAKAPTEEAQDMKKKLEEAGAVIELKA